MFRALILILAVAVMCGTAFASNPYLYAGDNSTGTLYRIDPTTGATVASVPVTLGGNQVLAIKGLTAEPSSGELYAVVVQQDPPADPGDGAPPGSWFKLVVIAPDTGVATLIGVLGDAFAGLAFAPLPSEGVTTESLLGVTGDGAATAETLYIIDIGNASTTPLMTLGNGDNGETIAFNTTDGLLYHLSGWVGGNSSEGGGMVFENINLGTLAITNIPLTGTPFDAGNGLVFDALSGEFLVAGGYFIDSNGDESPNSGEGFPAPSLFSLTTGGFFSLLGPLDAYFGGMAFSYLVPVEFMSFSVE